MLRKLSSILMVILFLQIPVARAAAEDIRMVFLPLVPRYGVSGAETETLTMLLGSSLVEQGDSFITIIEPPKTEAMVSEQRLQLSGLVADESAIAFGRRMNANMLLTGFCSRFDDELTAAVILFDVTRGEAVAGRSTAIREETLTSDIALFTGELIADLRHLQSGVTGEEIDQLVRTGRSEEAYRLAPLAAGEDSRQLQELRADELKRELTGRRREPGDQDLEKLFLLLTLSSDDEKLVPLAADLFETLEKKRIGMLEDLSSGLDTAVRERRFEDAEIIVREMETYSATPLQIAAARKDIEEAQLAALYLRGRTALIRRENESAAFYGYKAMELEPLNGKNIERIITAEQRQAAALDRVENLGDRGGRLFQLSFGYGAADDALAKLSEKSVGMSGSASYSIFRPLVEPLEMELGVAGAWSRREGELTSSTNGTVIDISADVMEMSLSAGITFRLERYDAGLRLRAGSALFLAENDGSRTIAPAIVAAPELFIRYFYGRHLFFGAELSFPAYFPLANPRVSALDFSASLGWNL